MSSPWLLFSHGTKFGTHTLLSMKDGKCYTKHIEERMGNAWYETSYGWYLVMSKKNKCYFLNPVTSEKIELPPIPSMITWSAFAILSPPDNHACRVILRTVAIPYLLSCCPGDAEWTRHPASVDNVKKSRCVIDSNGKLHLFNAVSCGRFELSFYAVVIDVNPHTTTITFTFMENDVNQVDSYGNTSNSFNHLVEVDAEIYAVMKYHYKLSFSFMFDVYKLNACDKTWIKLNAIGDRAFFLSPNHAFSCSATPGSGFSNNCIYFVEENDSKWYCMDLEDESMSVFDPCVHVGNPCLTPSWIQGLVV